MALPARGGPVRHDSHAGFTLIELMIAVVIVGILLAVALPAYQNSMQKGRRSDAMSALQDAANRQEQFMLDRSRYTDNMIQLGFGADPFVSEEGHYSVDASLTAEPCDTPPTGTCYVLTATPLASSPQSKDVRCASFTLDSSGSRKATGTTATECW